MLSLVQDRTSVRVLGTDSPIALRLRPVPEPGSRDPLRGKEVWRTVTDATVLAGPRSPAGAVRLLDQLRCPAMTRMRQRLLAAAHDAPADHVATAAMLGTLLRWPRKARAALVDDVADAVEAAFTGHRAAARPEVSRALGWVLALALSYPGEPLALAPILLRTRRLPAGSSFILPAGWPFMRLAGAAIGIGTDQEELLEIPLGRDHGDVSDLVGALERQPARAGLPHLLPAGPGDVDRAPHGALHRAFDLARHLCAAHPQLTGSGEIIDLRRRGSRRSAAVRRGAARRGAG